MIICSSLCLRTSLVTVADQMILETVSNSCSGHLRYSKISMASLSALIIRCWSSSSFWSKVESSLLHVNPDVEVAHRPWCPLSWGYWTYVLFKDISFCVFLVFFQFTFYSGGCSAFFLWWSHPLYTGRILELKMDPSFL